MSRRKPQLIPDAEPERLWSLTLADGTVREPLNHLHIRAIVESGAATADSQILRRGETTWHRLGDHPLWAEVAPPTSSFVFKRPAAIDPGVQANDVRTATPRMRALWQEQRDLAHADLMHRAAEEDRGRFQQALGLGCAVVGLICVGDIIVFTCSTGLAFVLLVGFVRLISLWLIWRILR